MVCIVTRVHERRPSCSWIGTPTSGSTSKNSPPCLTSRPDEFHTGSFSGSQKQESGFPQDSPNSGRSTVDQFLGEEGILCEREQSGIPVEDGARHIAGVSRTLLGGENSLSSILPESLVFNFLAKASRAQRGETWRGEEERHHNFPVFPGCPGYRSPLWRGAGAN